MPHRTDRKKVTSKGKKSRVTASNFFAYMNSNLEIRLLQLRIGEQNHRI
jgi:hypothetical protein